MLFSYMAFALSVQWIFRIFLTSPQYGLGWQGGHLGFFHAFFQKGKMGVKLLKKTQFFIAAGFLKQNMLCVIHLFWRH